MSAHKEQQNLCSPQALINSAVKHRDKSVWFLRSQCVPEPSQSGQLHGGGPDRLDDARPRQSGSASQAAHAYCIPHPIPCLWDRTQKSLSLYSRVHVSHAFEFRSSSFRNAIKLSPLSKSRIQRRNFLLRNYTSLIMAIISWKNTASQTITVEFNNENGIHQGPIPIQPSGVVQNAVVINYAYYFTFRKGGESRSTSYVFL